MSRHDLGPRAIAALVVLAWLVGCAPRSGSPSASTAPRQDAATAGASGASTSPSSNASPGATIAPTTVAGGSAVAAGEMPGSMPVPVTVTPWQGEVIGGGLRGVVLATRNYRLHSTLRDQELQDLLPQTMESAFKHYRTAIVDLPLPTEPMRTYVFGSRSEWNRFTQARLSAEEAQKMLRLRRGAYTANGEVVLHDLGRTDTIFLAIHEGWHQYSQSVFREPLPIWLEEALATYMEGHRVDGETGEVVFLPWRNLERFGELRARARRDELIPIADLLDRPPQAFLSGSTGGLLTYYAQLWALSQFLVNGEGGRYRGGLERLLMDAVDGSISSRIAHATGGPRRRAFGPGASRLVIATYFNADFDAFVREYDAFLERIIQRGAGSAIWRGRSPLEPGAIDESFGRPRG